GGGVAPAVAGVAKRALESAATIAVQPKRQPAKEELAGKRQRSRVTLGLVRRAGDLNQTFHHWCAASSLLIWSIAGLTSTNIQPAISLSMSWLWILSSSRTMITGLPIASAQKIS